MKSIFTLFDLDPEIVARLVEKIIAGSSPYEGQFLETLLILLGNAVRTQKNICKKIRQEADEYNH